MNIVISHDREPGQIELVHALANKFIFFNPSMICVVPRQIRKVQRIGHDSIHFLYQGRKITIVLFMSSGHVQITEMNPRNNFGSVAQPGRAAFY
jgi:hypothetical protein